MSATIRDAIYEISPPWMRERTANVINQAFGSVIDALADVVEQGVNLRLPGRGSNTALPYIGNDREIERGPTQSDTGYIDQLTRAFDTWANAGGARTILSQFRAYFAPGGGPPLSLVSQHPNVVKAIWHVIDAGTGVVTRTTHDNWLWDESGKWHRGWVIIDGSSLCEPDYWDQVGTWGDGGVWGCNGEEMNYFVVRNLQRILAKWKPLNVLGQILVCLQEDFFTESNSRPTNPDGDGDDDAWRASVPVMFMEPVTT